MPIDRWSTEGAQTKSFGVSKSVTIKLDEIDSFQQYNVPQSIGTYTERSWLAHGISTQTQTGVKDKLKATSDMNL